MLDRCTYCVDCEICNCLVFAISSYLTMGSFRVEFDDLPEFYSLKATDKIVSKYSPRSSSNTNATNSSSTKKSLPAKAIADDLFYSMRKAIKSPTILPATKVPSLGLRRELRDDVRMYCRPTSTPILVNGKLDYFLGHRNTKLKRELQIISYVQPSVLSFSIHNPISSSDVKKLHEVQLI